MKKNCLVETKKLDDTGIEPGTSHMLSECDNQLHQTPISYSFKVIEIISTIIDNQTGYLYCSPGTFVTKKLCTFNVPDDIINADFKAILSKTG